MSGIYRGPGGTGDATQDASSQAVITITAKDAALAAQTAAETAATNASTSATNASNSASSASTSASTATTKASEASTSATNAAASEANALTYKNAAATSATNAATSASAASTSATSASTSASTATTQATNASNSASAASTSATNAANSATAAATSATNAASSATSASGSASTATTQASNASTSATNAAASATSASGSASTATTQAGIATTQASNATTSATSAADSATTASTQATNAANSATSAATSATNAATSATNAATSEANAAASYDSFDDRYLGPKASAPTLDNDGNALLTGALYFNTTTNEMKVWSGSAWLNAYASLSGALLATNNLSDLNNAATARTNLGVTATGVDTTYAYRANNLSDLASASTARTNLGLGSIATQAANSVSITGGSITGITDITLADGGTGASSAPAAMTNLMGFTSTATAGGTTTLTNTSSYYQLFTGSTTQTIVLPVTSTLQTGWTFHICNNSTGALTVNSSGGNLVISVIAGTTVMCTCIGTTLTTAADWEAGYTDFSTLTGTGNVVLSASPTLSGTTSVTALSASSTLTATGTLSLSGSTTGTHLFGTTATTGTTTIGGTSQTGTIIVGRSTVSQQTDIQAGATASGSTKTLNIGTGGLTGSTTAIAIGSTAGTSTTTLNGTLSLQNALPVTQGGTGSTTSTGSGSVVLATSPTITTPTINQINTSVANTSLGAGNASIMKNRIINGAMVIDQRNAGASVTITTAEEFITDRWQFAPSASSKLTAQQSTTAPAGFNNSLLLTSSAATSVGSGDYYFLGQKIEGFNFADCGWGTADAKTVTLSFWCRSSITGTYGGALVNSAQNRSYPFSYTILAANTWEQKSITIAGDTSGTWIGATNGTGVRLRLGFGIGSTYSGTAGAWAAANYMAPTGATNWISTSGATFYITGVQLEVGSSATGFEYRQYGTELALCQRYYAKTYNTNTSPATVTNDGSIIGVANGSANRPLVNWSLPVVMRANPTTTLYSPYTGTSGVVRNLDTNADITGAVLFASMASIVWYTSTTQTNSNAITAQITVSSEL